MDALVTWLHVADLNQVDAPEVLTLVRPALEEMQDDEEWAERLEAIREHLWNGDIPRQDLMDLAEDWGAPEPEPEGALLEQEMRQLAFELPAREWQTPTYMKLFEAVQACLDDDLSPLEQVLEEVRASIERAWEPYMDTPVAEHEVTAETLVGHQMLQEGLDGWLQALDLAEEAADGEAEWDEVLALAQRANRLLVAVQHLAQRVRQEAAVGP